MTYLRSTRHPWASLLFLLPLLAAYEGGVARLGGDRTYVAAQADAWLRALLENYGAGQVLAAPFILVAVLLLWSGRRWADRPADPVGTWFGMAFESALFAFLLWQFSHNFGPIVDRLGVKLEIVRSDPAAKVVTYIGAGIYEEVLFRLGLFSVVALVLRAIGLPAWLTVLAAALISALAFAAAHHVGAHGDPMQPYVFLFRVLAGLYFAFLFALRGLGIAVGAHAGYDVLVGVAVG